MSSLTESLAVMEALSSAARLVSLCIDLAQYLQKIEDVDATVAVFRREINDLSRVLSNIHDTVKNLGSSVIRIQLGQRHWDDVAMSMNDCLDTLESLDRVVRPPKKIILTGFLRRAREQVLLDWNSHDIQLLQRQIASCRQTMELSFQMITVYYFPTLALLLTVVRLLPVTRINCRIWSRNSKTWTIRSSN